MVIGSLYTFFQIVNVIRDSITVVPLKKQWYFFVGMECFVKCTCDMILSVGSKPLTCLYLQDPPLHLVSYTPHGDLISASVEGNVVKIWPSVLPEDISQPKAYLTLKKSEGDVGSIYRWRITCICILEHSPFILVSVTNILLITFAFFSGSSHSHSCMCVCVCVCVFY